MLLITIILIISNLSLINLDNSSDGFFKVSAGSSWTQTSDTDFSNGIFNNTEVSGTGETAEIKLEEFHNEWINKTNSIRPGPRIDQATAPVWNTDKIVMFGGWNHGINLNDTWIYDYSENSWTEVFPPNKVGPKYFHRIIPAGDGLLGWFQFIILIN